MDIVIGNPPELRLVGLRVDVVHVVQVEGDVLEVVLDLSVADAAEEVLCVDLALAVLSLVVVEAETVNLEENKQRQQI